MLIFSICELLQKRGFSLVEMLLVVGMLPLVVILSTTTYLNFQKKFNEIGLYSDVERHHRMLQLVLSDQDVCKHTLIKQVSEYKKDASKSLKVKKAEDGTLDTYTEKLMSVNGKEGVRLEHIGFKNLSGGTNEVYVDAQAGGNFPKEGYVTLEFKYKINNKQTIKRYHKLFVEVNDFPDEGEDIARCLRVDEGSTCPAGASFLTSFDESSLDPSSRETTGVENEGAELIRSFANTEEDARGLNCVSHAVCSGGQWKPRALCYNSCTKKFWADGLSTSKDKNQIASHLNRAEAETICEEEEFSIPKYCGGQLHTIRTEEGKFGAIRGFRSRLPIPPSGDQPPVLTGRFKCSYLGTWTLQSMRCSSEDPSEIWEIADPKDATADSRFTCSTVGQKILIQSEDRSKSKEIELDSIYSGKVLIGEPRRMAVLFENSPTSVSFYCKKNNLAARPEWKKVETTKYCGEAPAGETTGKVDILFSIDESASMADEIVRVKSNISRFVRTFVEGKGRGLDWRIIVDDRGWIQKNGQWMRRNFFGRPEHASLSTINANTITDVFNNQLMPFDVVDTDAAGTWKKDRRWTKYNKPTGWVKWQYQNHHGWHGAGEKHYLGIKYASKAGLFRSDAHLAIVVVTDDGAYRSGLHGLDWYYVRNGRTHWGGNLGHASGLHGYLKHIKHGDEDKLAGVYGVIPNFSRGWYSGAPHPIHTWCSKEDPNIHRSNHPVRLIARLTGGETYDLCSNNYARNLQNIADRVVERVLQVIGI